MTFSLQRCSQWFGDHINPILVKEMRQGMRSRQYMLVFLAVQVVMLFYLVFGIGISQGVGSSSDMEQMFWLITSVVLLVVLPLMGTNALSSENRESRLDLLMLTRLGSRRIVYGKWLAIVAQGVLLITSLLPYLVLRYYIGSVEFHESLMYALALLAGSAIVTGIAVCLSVIKSPILRWIVIIGAGIWGIPALFGTLAFGINTFSEFLKMLPWACLSGGLLVMLAMEFAASRFSPVPENHDTAKRLIVLAMFLLGAGTILIDDDIFMPMAVFAIGLIIVAWDGLCRPVSASPTIYEPFVRLGFFGRLAGRLLYPGWLPSIVFCAILYCLLIALIPLSGDRVNAEMRNFFILAAGAALFPFAVLLYTPFTRRNYGRLMFLIQLCLGLLMLLLHLIQEQTGARLTLGAGWIPTSVLFLELTGKHGVIGRPHAAFYSFYIYTCYTTTALSLIAIAIKAVPQHRLVAQMEKRATALLRTRKERASVAPPPVLEHDLPAADSADSARP
ncbi:hypothetical protein H5P28_09090 [Ruficoccus amylovorans]|uniref:ABC-2 family transporter protein n=1 Tax=Ruficoccus amylovorans TaxID=1804625 RepID=A0A842HDW3_9BACT|nr:hypothetical protein [Ruficoccus amylovorans]MBC2594410.1 hypothetical protein [Ruficoccus amylovorans]